MKRSVSILFVLLLAVAMLFSGCGGSGGSAEEPATSDSAQSDQADQEKAEAATEGMGDLLSSAYVDMMKGNEYLMKYKASMDMNGQMTEVTATMAVSGKNSAIISSGQGFESTMVMKDDKIYMIDHTNKMVTAMAQTQAAPAADTGSIDTAGINYVGTGNEDGLVYEEYTTDGGTLRYYFDGKKLVKIKMTAGGVDTVMEILEMSNDVPATMFDIPSDYQMISM
jgi:hypothetical protein